MRTKRRSRRLLVSVVSVWVVAITATVLSAASLPWPGADPAMQLVPGGWNRLELSFIGADDGNLAGAWPGPDHSSIHFATKLPSGEWQTDPTLSGLNPLEAPTDKEYWAPDLAFVEGGLSLVWTVASTNQLAVFYKSLENSDSDVVMAGIYGTVVSDLAATPYAEHIVFPASTNSEQVTDMDLYYSRKELDNITWPAPTAIVTGAATVWYPRIAGSPATDTVYVVWNHRAANSWRIYYMSGTWKSEESRMQWSAPLPLSPDSQTTTLPQIAVGPTGAIHVVWTEIVGGIGDIKGQHVYYRSPSGQITKLSGDAPLSLEPSFVGEYLYDPYVRSTIALTGSRLCVTWDGFDSSIAGSHDEITLRCSPDKGETWDPSVTVSQDGEAGQAARSSHPVVLVDEGDNAHVLWAQYQISVEDQPAGVYYRTGPANMDVHVVALPLVMRGR
ncbi:MAG: sialidase family protein [Anaerolineae bacterium]